MRSLSFDVRDAVRGLRRDRAYTLTVVVTLTLTIGATTAVFSIVDGVLLKPLAYRESQRLVSIRETWRQFADKIPTLAVNEKHFEYWRQHTRTFESMAQYIVLPANMTGAGDAAQVQVARVSGSLFDVLRVQAAIGRTLTPADEPSDRPEAAVVTDAAWRQRFSADRGVVGRSIVIDGRPRTIVGVLPADFSLPSQRLASAELFVPIHMDVSRTGWEGDHNNDAVGRLRAGATTEQAHAELDVLQTQVSQIATKEAGQPVTLASTLIPLTETVVGRARSGLLLLLGAIVAVLCIACSNLANLSLTRTVGRLRDAAIRSALGAGRSRLVARAVVEQLLLSAVAGTLGLAVAWAALLLFVRTAPIDLPRVSEVALDARVVAFAAGVSTLAGLVVAVLPAWRTARSDVEQSLRAGALWTTSDRGGMRTRGALLALQVALSLSLLVVTALLGASFMRLMNVDRGFAAERVLVVPLSLPAQRYEAEATRLAAYDRVIAALQALPGVQSATTLSAPPLSGSTQVNGLAPDGSTSPRSEHPAANYRFVGPDFFRTLGITIVRGRSFGAAEGRASGTMPALVSEGTARRIWPGEDAVGKRFSRGIPGEAGFEVVGIVADAKLTSLDQPPPLMVYLPYWWRTRNSPTLVIKTATGPSALMPQVRRAVREIDGDIAIGDARPLEQLVDGSIAARRYQAQLFMAFGGVALFIATLGVWAVTSYGVSRRRREMNIRVALGAQRSQVIRLVLGQVTVPIVAGLVAGTLAALSLGAVVASLLFDVRARDPIVLGSVVSLVAVVGVTTCALAASQGLRIDPASALREE
ncbi:MAG TPA: ABC transporter permease [Vicinamibacterales bacterium]|nr:ABC transporter permease [Vicinamibacterales bacterium]